ncbi:MAG: hypothetical protein ABJN72_00930 [Sulfitobacter sp.]
MEKLLSVLIFTPALVFAQTPEAKTKTIDCYCTDSTGGRMELGESLCLKVGGRTFTAQCQMSLNVPMWRELFEGCLSSGLGLGGGRLYSDTPQQSVQPLAIYPHI